MYMPPANYAGARDGVAHPVEQTRLRLPRNCCSRSYPGRLQSDRVGVNSQRPASPVVAPTPTAHRSLDLEEHARLLATQGGSPPE
jgi:hypothetical protein